MTTQQALAFKLVEINTTRILRLADSLQSAFETLTRIQAIRIAKGKQNGNGPRRSRSKN